MDNRWRWIIRDGNGGFIGPFDSVTAAANFSTKYGRRLVEPIRFDAVESPESYVEFLQSKATVVEFPDTGVDT